MNPLSFVQSLGRILKGRPRVSPTVADNPTLKVMLARRSVRKFKATPIPDDVMHAILEAGRTAPSTVNLQTWSFGVYDQKQWKATFGTPMPFLGDRAVMLLADMARTRAAIPAFPFKPLVEHTLSVLNCGIAAYAMNVAAEALGVQSVMLSETGKTGFYDAEYLAKKLGCPEGVTAVTTIVFGYAAGKTSVMPPRYPMEEVVFTGKYPGPNARRVKAWAQEMAAGYRAMFITHSFRDKLGQYLGKADAAEVGLKRRIFWKAEEFKKKI